jgi:hypothetical protein
MAGAPASASQWFDMSSVSPSPISTIALMIASGSLPMLLKL